MTLATILQIIVGLMIPALVIQAIYNRTEAPIVLVVPGILVGLVVAFITPLIQSLTALLVTIIPAEMAVPVIVSLTGFAIGLLIAILLTAALLWLAPGARTREQILMIGAGYAATSVVLRALLSSLILLSQMQITTTSVEASAPIVAIALEGLAALGQVGHGISLVLLVGMMFLTGQVGWFFRALFWGAIGTGGGMLFAQSGPVTGAIWWLLIGGISLVIIWRSRSDGG